MTSVREIMSSEVSTIDASMTLREAVEALRGWNVSGAPVVRGSEIVGVLSVVDVLELQATTEPIPAFREDQAEFGDWGEPEPWEEGDAPPLFFVDFWEDSAADVRERLESTEGPEWDFLADHDVGEVMSRKLLKVRPQDGVRAAARLMSDARVHRVLVVDGRKLAGVLSASDIVRAVGEGLV